MVNLRLTRRAHQRRGFTVLELMVTVALIGILAGVAIPNFVSYQARARRSEAFTHLSGLARAQKSYQAENDIFLDSSTSPDGPTLPDPGDYGGLGVDKMPWDAKTASFYDQVGWGPEGRVNYTYESNGADPAGLGGCSCQLCFTLAAHGDVDGDDAVASVVYVHPEYDINGTVVGTCQTFQGGGLGAPVSPNGTVLYDEPAVNLANDDF